MKVLVVGGGGREHALSVALARSPEVTDIYCAPGNGGIAEVAGCLPNLQASDIDGLLRFATDEGIDLTVVGPEAPLVAGIVDRFREAGLRIYGPDAAGARLEGSKAFAKQLFERNNIPAAASRTFSDHKDAREFLEAREVYPVVIKADGLAGGKGVLICEDKDEAVKAIEDVMVEQRFGEAGNQVLVEEFLRGEEASIHAVTDGKTLVVLPTSQDHKRIGDGDKGLNTGGMGAYSPAPVVTPALLERIERQILIPTLHALRLEGIDYRGTLYAGLMLTKGGPRLLEYNVRFGDPETQVILPRIKSDFALLLKAAADQTLADIDGIEFDDRTAVGVVMAAEGYPERYQTGKAISGLDQAGRLDDVQVYHAGTSDRSGQTITAGGRVLCVTALGDDVRAARDRSYEAVEQISWDGAYYRKDIAHRAL